MYYDFRKQSHPSTLTPSDITNVQLEKGSSATSYEPYVGGVKAPNPYYPQEIHSVGDKTLNVFDLASMTFSGNNDYIRYTKDANSITFTNNVIGNGEYMYTNYTGFLKPNTTYTVSAKVTKTVNQEGGGDAGTMQYVLWLQNTMTWDSGDKIAIVGKTFTQGETLITFTTPADMSRYQYIVMRASGYCSYKFENIMMVEGEYTSETMPAYEPYGYKVPIKVSGQNIIDMTDTSYDFDEPVSMWASTVFNFTKVKKYFKPNTTYTISYDVECTSVPEYTDYFDNRYGFFLYSGVSGYSSIIMYQYGYLSVGDKNSYILTFTTPANLYDDNSNYRILGYSNYYKNGDASVASTMKFSNIQIIEGSYTSGTMPSYEPYHTPINTKIYLSAPLRKIGDGEVKSLPVGYTQLEYIQSTGTQYIDTGIIANQDTSTDLDFQLTSTDRQKGIYGIYETEIKSYYIYTGRDGIFQVGFGGGRYVDTQFAIDLNRHKVNFKDFKITIDNTVVSTYTKSSVSYTQTQLLFNMHKADGTTYNGASVKIYSCKIYNNNVLVRNFIPAKNSSNAVGMYDLVNNVFYTNQGTGTFTAGPEIYADYIDFENQKVYRNIGIDSVTKNSSIGKFGGVTNYSAFYMAYNNLPDYDGTFKNLALLSPTFAYHEAGGGNINQYWTGDYQISSAVAEGYKRILFTLPSTITDTTSAKTWLETNPIEFYYSKKIVSEESITLPDILLNKGTNIIEVDTTTTPSNMWVKYKGKN